LLQVDQIGESELLSMRRVDPVQALAAHEDQALVVFHANPSN
jgi:hypothetical protein